MSSQKIYLDLLPAEMIGVRLDKALAQISQINSRSQAAILIDNNAVQVNGKIAKASYVLQAKDILEVEILAAPPTELIPWDHPLDIIFEDQDLLVVNKPSGMVVHPAAGHYTNTLVNALIFHTRNLSEGSTLDRPGLVHRIDKETSGLLVVAKNNASHENLAQQFKNRTIDRKYYAVVEGKLKNSSGSYESYLARHPNHRKKFSSVRDLKTNKILLKTDPAPDIGKWSKTHYKILKTHARLHYIELKLETGRTHQIRVHLSEMGAPVVGDLLYGSKKELPRFYLHAADLGFIHPQSGEKLFFKKDWPDEDLKLIQSWGL